MALDTRIIRRAHGKPRLRLGAGHESGSDALAAAPAAETATFDEEYCFTELQFDVLADVLANVADKLHREWQQDIEHIERRLLETMVRFAFPAERAEETAYALKDRVARMEQRLERQLSETSNVALRRRPSTTSSNSHLVF